MDQLSKFWRNITNLNVNLLKGTGGVGGVLKRCHKGDILQSSKSMEILDMKELVIPVKMGVIPRLRKGRSEK